MTTKVATFPLRLPLSLKAAIEKLAAADGTSMNHFLVMAAAEKLSAMQTTEKFFAAREGHADKAAAIAFLTRSSGEPSRPGDEPDGHSITARTSPARRLPSRPNAQRCDPPPETHQFDILHRLGEPARRLARRGIEMLQGRLVRIALIEIHRAAQRHDPAGPV